MGKGWVGVSGWERGRGVGAGASGVVASGSAVYLICWQFKQFLKTRILRLLAVLINTRGQLFQISLKRQAMVNGLLGGSEADLFKIGLAHQ